MYVGTLSTLDLHFVLKYRNSYRFLQLNYIRIIVTLLLASVEQ